MIVSDTNILSTFARVGVLDLIFKLFPRHQVAIPKAVYEEILEAVRRGCVFLHSVLTHIDSGHIHLLRLTPEEQ
jgi:predicted nucleic acid-binding protein